MGVFAAGHSQCAVLGTVGSTVRAIQAHRVCRDAILGRAPFAHGYAAYRSLVHARAEPKVPHVQVHAQTGLPPIVTLGGRALRETHLHVVEVDTAQTWITGISRSATGAVDAAACSATVWVSPWRAPVVAESIPAAFFFETIWVGVRWAFVVADTVVTTRIATVWIGPHWTVPITHSVVFTYPTAVWIGTESTVWVADAVARAIRSI